MRGGIPPADETAIMGRGADHVIAGVQPADQAACTQRLMSLQQLGITSELFAGFEVAGTLISTAPWIILSGLIFWRKSSVVAEILFSAALILFGTLIHHEALLTWVTYFHPGLRPAVDLMNFLAATSLIMWFVFPDGRFVPPWTAVVALVWVLRDVTWLLYRGSQFDMASWPAPIPQLLTAGFVAGLVYSLLYRYRRSNRVQRQQIKWVAVGAVLFGPVVVGRFFVDTSPTLSGTLNYLVSEALVFVLAFIFAMCFRVSILRYRLWDIDIIISRTLVYLPLTAIVTGIFASTVGLAQRFFLARTGSKSEIATGIATLVTVALFDPVKSTIQKIVDARFKEGGDPAGRLKAFGDTVENELGVLDPPQVTQRLLHETVKAFDACSGAVYMGYSGNERLVHTYGTWRGVAQVIVPLQAGATRLGRLELGERSNGADYGPHDHLNLENLAAIVAQALTRDGTWAES